MRASRIMNSGMIKLKRKGRKCPEQHESLQKLAEFWTSSVHKEIFWARMDNTLNFL